MWPLTVVNTKLPLVKQTAKTVLTNHLALQRESPLGENDGDEVGKSGCMVGHEWKRLMRPDPKRYSQILWTRITWAPLQARMGKNTRSKGRVRNQGMECESLLLF